MIRKLVFKVFIAVISIGLAGAGSLAGATGPDIIQITHHHASVSARPLEERAEEITRLIADRQFLIDHRRDEIIVRFANEARFRRVRLAAGENIFAVVRQYQSRRDVIYAEPNYIAHKFEAPNDPFFALQWHLQAADRGGIELAPAREITQGENVVVAVIDTGVAYENYRENSWNNFTHAPDLAATEFVAGYDFVNNDTHPNDDEGHGTHVTGTIAGSTNNNLGVAGVAPRAKIMPIKVLDNRGAGTYADIAEGIIWAADHGARVINLSLGGPVGTTYLQEALAYAHGRGVVIVAAAGNDGRGSVSYPAAYDEFVIAVGATGADKSRPAYSNYGTALDVVAPGGDLSVDQNRDGYADGVLQQTFGRRYDEFNYYFYQGTSMASPHVSGIAALILATNPNRTPAEVQNIIQSTAEDLGASGRDNEYGWGLANAARAAAANSAMLNNPPTGPIPPASSDQPPTVEFISPAADARVSDQVKIQVDALDDIAVLKVDFLLDENLLTTDQVAPFEIDFDSTMVADGPHALRALAFDSLNQTAEAEISISVFNAATISENANPPIIFEDNFESNSLGSNWTGSSRAWSISARAAADGQRALWLAGETHNDPLISRPFDLTGMAAIEISFSWLITRGVDRDEYLAFDISSDNGATWQEVARLRGNADPEDQWLIFKTTVAGIPTVQLRFRGEMSRRREDGYIDGIRIMRIP